MSSECVGDAYTFIQSHGKGGSGPGDYNRLCYESLCKEMAQNNAQNHLRSDYIHVLEIKNEKRDG